MRTRTRSQASRTRMRTWKLVLEDKDFPGGQQHCCEAVRWDWRVILNLTGAQWHISHPFVTQSLQDDGVWYFACYVSLLNPRKFSRTWTSEDKDMKIGPRGQGLPSRTTTLIINMSKCQNSGSWWMCWKQSNDWMQNTDQLILKQQMPAGPAGYQRSL